ncbi:hypothetical protein BMF89_09050 [Arthrobacter sp. SRS-W-1-2016]|nr:hypothetical protein BMF89_09050 [Arthrobacter sp. SRS-W-1-2016]
MKLYEDEVTLVDGVAVTTVERTWLDMAEMLTVDELVVIGDSCVRRPRVEFEGRDTPLCTLEDLQWMIDRHRGKRGLRKAKDAIQLIRVGSDSPQESLLRLAIARAGLPEPELNDISRSERYEALGWTEVRISKRHMVNDAKPAVAKIRTALIQAGWRPTRS